MWKQALMEFAQQFQHPSWGLAHSKRIHDMTLHLASLRGEKIDADALLAAAYLHDMGAMPPYKKPGVEHVARALDEIDAVLAQIGFLPEKVDLVREMIKGHMYAATPAECPEAVLFHDADTLDFMGAIGVARIIAIVGLHEWAPDLPSAINVIRRHCQILDDRLITPEAQVIGSQRHAEMQDFLDKLGAETSDFGAV